MGGNNMMGMPGMNPMAGGMGMNPMAGGMNPMMNMGMQGEYQPYSGIFESLTNTDLSRPRFPRSQPGSLQPRILQ
jgi:hypothetical protein